MTSSLAKKKRRSSSRWKGRLTHRGLMDGSALYAWHCKYGVPREALVANSRINVVTLRFNQNPEIRNA